jgi:aspartyl-tRNA(Asn)/glutamyl-tRNA(Gln) amidotransferase subunit B
MMNEVLRSITELPVARFRRYVETSEIAPDDARILVGDRALADYFDLAEKMTAGKKGRAVANWIINELLGKLNASGLSIAESPMSAANLAALVLLVEVGTISGKIGKEIFEESYKTGEEPRAIVERRGVQQISDEATLWPIIDRIVGANAKQAADYLGGKDGLFGFFVGQVMKETQGRANPVLTTELLHRRLGR